jgi:hypothetical protein
MQHTPKGLVGILGAFALVVIVSCSFKIDHTSPPPPPPSTPVVSASVPGELFVYPRNGQTQAQIAADRTECNTWAAGQAGYDPSRLGDPQSQQRFQRAVTACLEGRGYTVR